mgnify:CR=1 FL=1
MALVEGAIAQALQGRESVLESTLHAPGLAERARARRPSKKKTRAEAWRLLRTHIKGAKTRTRRGRPANERRKGARRWAWLAAKARWRIEVRTKLNAVGWARLGLAAARHQRERDADKSSSARPTRSAQEARREKCPGDRVGPVLEVSTTELSVTGAEENSPSQRLECELDEMREVMAHLRLQQEEVSIREKKVRHEMEQQIRELHKVLATRGVGAGDLVNRWNELRSGTCVNEEEEPRKYIQRLEREAAGMKKENKQLKKNAAALFGEKEARVREVRDNKEKRRLQDEVRRLELEAEERMQARQRMAGMASARIVQLEIELNEALGMAGLNNRVERKEMGELKCVGRGVSSERSIEQEGSSIEQGGSTVGTQTVASSCIQFGWSLAAPEHDMQWAAADAARRVAEEAARGREWARQQTVLGLEPNPNPNPKQKTTEEVPSWAMVADNAEERKLKEAVWRVKFEGRTPRMDSQAVVEAMLGAVKGTANFTVLPIGDLLKFDYDEPWARHFIHGGRGDSTEGKAEWRRAWLRREMRGLVVRRTGEVVMRGLHKFFNIHQLQETNVRALSKTQIHEVLEKLDGQMVAGIVVGEDVQLWSRKGNTAVSTAALRVAREIKGEYEGLVKDLAGTGHTAIFEFVGEQSKIKANEGPSPRLVLIAVREQVSGNYATHDQMQLLGRKHGGIEVVRRFKDMESKSIHEIRETVFRSWAGREGVVVKFSGQQCTCEKKANYGKNKSRHAKVNSDQNCRLEIKGWRSGACKDRSWHSK